MRTFIKIFVAVISISFVMHLIGMIFFDTHHNRPAEITELKQSAFDFSSAKPIYFQVRNRLYYSEDGKVNYDEEPIWKGDIEETFVSPNGNFILIYADEELTLLNYKGIELFHLDNCTGKYRVQEARKSGRFLSMEVQWSENSDFFLIGQDRVWQNNFSKKNKSSIYKFSIHDRSFKPFVHFDEELTGAFYLSRDGNFLYYEFATDKGDLAFKKLHIKNKTVVSEHYKGDSLRLTNIDKDSIFINYKEYKEQFERNSYDRASIITDALTEDGLGLYYKDKDTIIQLMSGMFGNNGPKQHSFGYLLSGFFLPGNRYFIANISAVNLEGQVVIDTRSFKLMRLKKKTTFYFNINSNDCNDFVFRYDIEPNVEFATSASIEIEERTGK